MRADDKAKRREEMNRGMQARSILDSPIWRESYDSVVNRLLSRMLAAECADEETLECKRQILALHAVKRRLETEMQTGVLAEKQLEESNDGE